MAAKSIFDIEHTWKPNPPILKQFILAPSRYNNYLVLLPMVDDDSYLTRANPNEPVKVPPRVVAVYRPTGRGPFRGHDGTEGWEYEFVGVRIDG